MAYYISTPAAIATRRMMNRFFNDEWTEETPDVTFPVDIVEEDEAYVLTAFLPGVNSEDLNIQVQSNVLSVSGELKAHGDDKTHFLLRERPSGKFYRSFELPDPLDAGKTEASLVNGVLSVRVPKAEEAKPRSIKVNAN